MKKEKLYEVLFEYFNNMLPKNNPITQKCEQILGMGLAMALAFWFSVVATKRFFGGIWSENSDLLEINTVLYEKEEYLVFTFGGLLQSWINLHWVVQHMCLPRIIFLQSPEWGAVRKKRRQFIVKWWIVI